VVDIVIIGLIMAIGTLAIFMLSSEAKAVTMAFTTLVFFQLFNALNRRSEHNSLFSIGMFSNHWLWLAILLSVALQCAVVYVPFLQSAFSTVPLTIIDWGKCTLVSVSVLVYGEASKLFKR